MSIRALLQRKFYLAVPLLVLLIGVFTGCREPTPTLSTLQPIKEWLWTNAIPFETTEPGSGFEDLMPLKELIGDARIVALGETTHGTQEFYQMKHRLVEFLVEEMDFNLFAIEANWPEANRVNEYVQTCEGNPATPLRGLYNGTLITQEVLDMIRWMCAHNQETGDTSQISFAGFDMQFQDRAIDNVLSYFQEVEPSYMEIATSLYACIRWHDRAMYSRLSDTEQATCRNGLQGVLNQLAVEQENYQELSSPLTFAMAEQSARVVMQREACLYIDPHFCERDRFMAENVVWLLEQAGTDAKIILWAHNGHVGNSVLGNGQKSMGSYLREFYGDEMVIFGFASYQGTFNAVHINQKTGNKGTRLTEYELPPPHKIVTNGFLEPLGCRAW